MTAAPVLAGNRERFCDFIEAAVGKTDAPDPQP
jgi:hypothetical protein